MKKIALPSRSLWLSASLFVLVACSSSLAESSPAAAGGDFRWSTALARDTKLEIRDRNGPITIEPSRGDALEVVAVKTGKKPDVDRVTVTARQEGDTVRVCALWPGDDPSTCQGSTRDEADAKVEIRVRVPAKVVSLDAKTMNGGIAANSPRGDVKLVTMNGAIDVGAEGSIVAETMNGAVVARVAKGRPARLETKNGRVELVLAAAADADVEASTMNGHVTSELGTVPTSSLPRIHDAKFRIGAGGTPVTLRTMNGDVVVKRGS